jgi:hypothetical protein
MVRERLRSDDIDRYRLKKAETDREKIQALEDAIEKAVDRAQMNYLWISLFVAVTLFIFLQTLKAAGFEPIPPYTLKWCIVVATVVIVLPYQLRRLKGFF